MPSNRHSRKPRFGIRKKILLFALFATLVPSLLLGWIAYYKTGEILQQQTEQTLQGAVVRLRTALDGWLAGQYRNLEIFSNSFVLMENLQRFVEQRPAGAVAGEVAGETKAARQLTEYLDLLRGQTQDYRRLLLLDLEGRLVAQSPQTMAPAPFSETWQKQLDRYNNVLLPLAEGEVGGQRLLLLAVPVLSPRGIRTGYLAAEFDARGLAPLLRDSAAGQRLLLLNGDKRVLLAAPVTDAGVMVDISLLQPLQLQFYPGPGGGKMVGLFTHVDRLPWLLVAEVPYRDAFAAVDRLRDLSLLLALLLLAGFGLLAWFVAQSILSPLRRLTDAAAEVAAGNLDIKLQTKGRDELGLAIRVFNDMVVRLRESRELLQRISTTDALTGLANRRHLMDILALQFQRFQRNGIPFSLLMVDIDHFKRINDTYGHLAGDAVLERAGALFRELLRSVDSAGRYGGEEFLVILEQASPAEALLTAERIRAAFERLVVQVDDHTIHFTVSIGVATVRRGEAAQADLIGRADTQLYRAKQQGRNRVLADTTDA